MLNKPLSKLTYRLTERRENLHAPDDVMVPTNQIQLRLADLHIPNMAEVFTCFFLLDIFSI